METMPQPKAAVKSKAQKKAEAAEAKAAGGEDDGKKKKKKKAGPDEDLPPPTVWITPDNQSVQDTMNAAPVWSIMNKVNKKFSSGVSQTQSYDQKVATFSQLFPNQNVSPIMPMQNFIGEEPDVSATDPYVRRKIQQLHDVELISEKEPEELMTIMRQPKKVLTEDNLSKILNASVEKLNIEGHYWLSNEFIGKISTVTFNLTNLCLRRMPHITNMAFANLFGKLTKLVSVDLSDCVGLKSSALQLLLDKNKNIEDLQIAGCHDALDDLTCSKFLKMPNIDFLDISFSKQLTDKGLNVFKDKKLGLTQLMINGCPLITSAGLSVLIKACSATLLEFEGSLNDQEGMQNDFMKQLGQCWNIEFIDISGCKNIDDSGFQQLATADIQLRAGVPALQPGLIKLHTLKCNLTKITDSAMPSIYRQCAHLHHLELARNDITEVSIKSLAKDLPKLMFLDISGVPGITLTIIEEIEEKKPSLMMRQWRSDKFDKTDNGLRVPRRVVEEEKKKGKKKK